MQRLTARILLVLLLVSVMAPAALAATGPQQHACCMRKPATPDSAPAFDHQMEAPGRGNCCPPMCSPHWAQAASQPETSFLAGSARQFIVARQTDPSTSFRSTHSGRGPPRASA